LKFSHSLGFIFEEIVKSYYSLYLVVDPTTDLKERISKKLLKLFYILYGIKLSSKKEIFKKVEESRMEPSKTMNRKEISSIGLEIFIPTLDSSISANKSTSVHDQLCQILRKFLENFQIPSFAKENLVHIQSFVDGKKKMEEIEWSIEKDSFQCNSFKSLTLLVVYNNLYYYLGMAIQRSTNKDNSDTLVPAFLTKEKYFEAIEMFELSCSADFKNPRCWKSLGLCFKEIFERMADIRDMTPNTKSTILKLGLNQLRMDSVNFENNLKVCGMKSLRCLEHSITLNPNDSETLYAIGSIYFQMLDFIEKSDESYMIERCTEALKKSNEIKKKMETWMLLGKLNEKQKNYSKSLEYYKESCLMSDISETNEPFYHLYHLLLYLYQRNENIEKESFIEFPSKEIKKKSKSYLEHIPNIELVLSSWNETLKGIYDGFYHCLSYHDLDYKSLLNMSRILELHDVELAKSAMSGIFKMKVSKSPKKPNSFEFKIIDEKL
jgi:tetratricopeptide (TPR) repeat protein